MLICGKERDRYYNSYFTMLTAGTGGALGLVFQLAGEGTATGVALAVSLRTQSGQSWQSPPPLPAHL